MGFLCFAVFLVKNVKLMCQVANICDTLGIWFLDEVLFLGWTSFAEIFAVSGEFWIALVENWWLYFFYCFYSCMSELFLSDDLMNAMLFFWIYLVG